jgi:hypothetical protein
MYSLKPLLIGVTLLALGVAGFVYNLTRPLPPVVWATPEILPTATPIEPSASTTPTTTPTPSSPTAPRQSRFVTVRRVHTSAPPKPPTPPTITLTNPQPAATYTAPASVALDAEVSPAGTDVRRVEFFYAHASNFGRSFCNTFKDVQLPAATLTRLGEARGSPYHLTWNNVAAGNYVIYGMVTDRRGVRQVSQPGFVSVNGLTAEGELKGWRAFYSSSLQPHISPTPKPTPPCLSVVIEAPSEEWQEGRSLTLKARVKGAVEDAGLRYDWKLSAGRIISGQGTNTITVDTKQLGGQVVQANLKVTSPATLCEVSNSHEIKVFQSLLVERARLWLNGESIFSSFNDFPMHTGRDTISYIIAFGRANGCEGEAAFLLREIKNHLIEKHGLRSEAIVTIDGGYDRELQIEVRHRSLRERPPTVTSFFPAEQVHTRRCSASEMSALLDGRARPLDAPYPKCPNVDQSVDYDLTLGNNTSKLNICPYNPEDPQTDEPLINLQTKAVGIYGNNLTYRYWTNGGQVVGGETGARWDLSAVRHQPGYYTAVVAATDECGCTSVASTSVLLTNFCTPCLSVESECSDEPASSRTSMRFTLAPHEWTLENSPSYRWRVSHGTIIEGQGTTSILVDTSKLDEGTQVVAAVEVGGLYQYCATEEAASGIVGEECPQQPIGGGNLSAHILGELRLARVRDQGTHRQTPQTVVTTSEVAVSDGAGGETTVAPQPTPATASGELPEKEYIKLAWPVPAKIQQSASIIVRYERTTATLNISNRQGDMTEPLNLPRLLKDRYGADYEVWANVKLRSAGFECPSCNEEQYQSLDKVAVEWSWNIISEREGTQTFNVELWVEGRRRSNPQEKRAPEKVWSKNNLKLFVKASQPTRNTIIASSALLCLFGLGFSLKGIRIHVGDRVAGDKFVGDRVAGDKVLGNKGDVYNVEHGVGVGRGVQMEDTKVEQNREEAE